MVDVVKQSGEGFFGVLFGSVNDFADVFAFACLWVGAEVRADEESVCAAGLDGAAAAGGLVVTLHAVLLQLGTRRVVRLATEDPSA